MKEYEITPPDGVPTTVLLTDEEAKARGLAPAAKTKAQAPANKQARPSNKARTPANKSGDAGS